MRIIKLDAIDSTNTFLKGIDIESNLYTKSSVNPFNYTIRKIY